MKGEQVDWKFVQRWSQLRDNMTGVSSDSDSGKNHSSSPPKRTKEVNINLGQGDELQQTQYEPYRGRSRKRSSSVGTHCYACGKQGHFAKECDWGQGKRCYNCGDSRHLAKDCQQPQSNKSDGYQRRERSNSNTKVDHGSGRGNQYPRGRGAPRGRGFPGGRGTRGGYGRGFQSHGGESEYYGIPNQYSGGAGYQGGGYIYNPGPIYNPYAQPFVPQQVQGDQQALNQQSQGAGRGATSGPGKLSGANAVKPLN